MKLLNVLIILALFFTTACSNSKKQGDVEDEVESTEESEVMADSDEEDLILEEDDESEEVAEIEEEPSDDYIEEESVSETNSVVTIDGDIQEYQVQKGDTLMLVAFKIYGDYSYWKNLREWNPGSRGLREGTTLKYKGPSQPFQWKRNGEPHLIQDGETLGVISNQKYGTEKRWKDLWDNNRPMIKNPNLIFAGFTLYYVPDRNVASE